jgi:hypothetical protein
MNDISSTSVSGGGQAQGARPLALADLASERKENLPRDYPRQQGDTIALSAQAHQMESGPGSKPPVQPVSPSDQSARSAQVGSRQIGIDASGSYKLD